MNHAHSTVTNRGVNAETKDGKTVGGWNSGKGGIEGPQDMTHAAHHAPPFVLPGKHEGAAPFGVGHRSAKYGEEPVVRRMIAFQPVERVEDFPNAIRIRCLGKGGPVSR